MAEKSEEFSWNNYLPQHRGLIALRFEESKRLKVCSLCGKGPVRIRTSLIHECLKRVGAQDLDARQYVRALALCEQHAEMDNDALGDWAWPGWR
jgi:hypothetical protein